MPRNKDGGFCNWLDLSRTISLLKKAIEQVGEGRAGPGNPMAVGYPSGESVRGHRSSLSLGQITPRELSAACLGVAGMAASKYNNDS